MRLEAAREVFDFFREHGFDAVVLGGVALTVQGIGRTADVDLLLTVREFAEVGKRTSTDSRVVTKVHRQGGTAFGEFRTEFGDVRFDLVDPSAFSGRRSGDEFFDYVNRKWAFDSKVGRTARPPVVWYTRMLIPGERYLERIIDDLDEGAQEEWLDQTVTLANYCRTTDRIRTMLKRLNELRRIVSPRGDD